MKKAKIPGTSVWGGILMILFPTLMMVACEKEAAKQLPPRPVFAMRLADASGLMERSFPGRARAGKEVNRSFRVSGPLITFPVNVGDEVKEGDILARIDPQDFETALRTLQGQLSREVARSKRAQQDLTRVENIRKKDPGAISQLIIDKAAQVRDSANASVRSLQASVQSAEDQLSYTYLKAPFDGVIVETYVDNFETVMARQPILRLLDPTSIEFVINVPENLISLSPYVDKIKVKFDALPGVEVSAQVKEIGKEASQATRTYPVTLVMDQPDGAEILPGMAGEAKIISKPPAESLSTGIEVPATAVFAGKDINKSFVWIVDDGTKTLSRREVQLGDLGQLGVQIKTGLKPGEWIVFKGVHSLKEGQPVRILETTVRKES